MLITLKPFSRRIFNISFKFLLLWSLLFIVSFAIRIPYFESNSYWFDGDEGIVGVMANDFLRTGKLPFLLYGQNYGFASLEVLSASLFISIFGNGVMSLKLAGLFIHSLGLTFLVRALFVSGTTFKRLIFLLILIVCFPPFFLWASQMRTLSFALACILFFICVVKKANYTWMYVVILISFFCFLSQPFMFLFVTPIIGVWLLNSEKKKIFFSLYVLILGSIILVSVFILANDEAVHQVAINAGAAQLQQFVVQSQGFLSGFTGFHYFTMNVETPLWWKFISIFSIVVLIMFTYSRLWRSSKTLLIFFSLSTLFFLFLLSFFVHYSPRYWVNFFGGLLLHFLYSIAFCETYQSRVIANVVVLLSFLFTLGVVVSNKFKLHFYDTVESERSCFSKLEDEVIRSDVKGLYTTDVFLQWQWNYLLGDKIPCTSFNKQERTNSFLYAVEKVCKKTPEKVGVIGFYGITEGLEKDSIFKSRIEQLGEKYYFVRNVKSIDIELAKSLVAD